MGTSGYFTVLSARISVDNTSPRDTEKIRSNQADYSRLPITTTKKDIIQNSNTHRPGPIVPITQGRKPARTAGFLVEDTRYRARHTTPGLDQTRGSLSALSFIRAFKSKSPPTPLSPQPEPKPRRQIFIRLHGRLCVNKTSCHVPSSKRSSNRNKLASVARCAPLYSSYFCFVAFAACCLCCCR